MVPVGPLPPKYLTGSDVVPAAASTRRARRFSPTADITAEEGKVSRLVAEHDMP